jgi:hypothetical protein
LSYDSKIWNRRFLSSDIILGDATVALLGSAEEPATLDQLRLADHAVLVSSSLRLSHGLAA